MFDLYQSPAVTFTANSYDDPVLCPNGVPVAGADANRDCGQQFNRKYGGNPNTQPEESTAFTLGFVFDVTPSVSLSVDYWNQEITGLIGLFPDSAAFSNYTANQSKFVRCSQGPRPMLPGYHNVMFLQRLTLLPMSSRPLTTSAT